MSEKNHDPNRTADALIVGAGASGAYLPVRVEWLRFVKKHR